MLILSCWYQTKSSKRYAVYMETVFGSRMQILKAKLHNIPRICSHQQNTVVADKGSRKDEGNGVKEVDPPNRSTL